MLYNREGFYAMLDGSNTVYSIPIYSANQIYASRAEILDLNIFQGSMNEVDRFSLFKNEELQFTIEAEPNPNVAWILTHPVESRADINNADEMINNLDLGYQYINVEHALDLENQINIKRNQLKKEHLENVELNKYNYQTGIIYSDMYSECEKIGDYIINVSEAIGEVNE